MMDFRVRLWVGRRLKISLRLHEQQDPEMLSWTSNDKSTLACSSKLCLPCVPWTLARTLAKRGWEAFQSREGLQTTECWPSPDGVVVHRRNVCQEHLLGMLHHSGQVAHEPARVPALSAPATWTVSLALHCEADGHISHFMPNALVAGIVEHA